MNKTNEGIALDMDGIINQLGEIRVSCISQQELEHAGTCDQVVNILSALLEGGAQDVETAKDIIQDYNALAKQYQAMYKRFGEAGHAVHKDGIWHCPGCNRRVNPGYSFCHCCGKKLDWDPVRRKGGRAGMPNRKQRRRKGPGKPLGMTYADELAMKRQLREACQQAANDKTVEVKSDIRTQRAMWLMCVTMNDAFGIGPERFQRFAQCLQERAEWYQSLVDGGDEEYAAEKLRQEAERCSGMNIQYLYEAELLGGEHT